MPDTNFAQTVPNAYRTVSAVETYLRDCGLEMSLMNLVKMRASQINGCAFCLNMHSQHARQDGESEQRLYVLNAWREAPFYTERERAALALTEHLTRLPVNGGRPAEVDRLFSPVEIANLTLVIAMINLWNRLVIGGGFHLEAA
jgi:AhpD family alkylhydroperoxidase